MRALPGLVLMLVALGAGTAAADSWIANGDFEADEPSRWPGGVIQSDVVHSGQHALRVDLPAGQEKVVSSYEGGVEVNQTGQDTIMAAFWMRFDATKPTPAIRGGISFHVAFEGEPFLAWYGPFELAPEEMGSWVYREARWKPRSPVTAIRPGIYLQGVEGSIYIDDLYLGPAVDLPVVQRETIPLSVTGSNGRFTDWPRLRVDSFAPVAHVFHLSGPNQANIELSAGIEVLGAAPAYLNSAWGSQYWTLYCPRRQELAEIFTDERLDLSQPGAHTISLPMSSFSDHGYDLAPGDYCFITDRFKNFLVYGTDKPEGEPYLDPRTGKSFNYWDAVKLEELSRAVGPSGIAAPFSLADLTSYAIAVAAQEVGGVVSVIPTLTDAGGAVVPLHGLELTATAGDDRRALAEKVEADGVPTGEYLWQGEGVPESLRLTGVVRLAAPDGVREEQIEQTVEVARLPQIMPAPPRPLELVGWGGGYYGVAQGATNGPASMRELIGDARAAGVSRLVVHARGSRDDAYFSEVSLSDRPEWDALAAAAEEGRTQSVDIYAGYILGIAQSVDLEKHPDWAQLDAAGKQTGWYCYNNPQVRAFHAALIAEIISKYDVAGVSLDYCRPGGGCYCPRCAALFEAKYGRPLAGMDYYDPEWLAFRRESITGWMREIAATVHGTREGAKLSCYVWGRLAPEADRAGQDWPTWLAEGTVDWLCVGQYCTSTPMFRSQCHTLRLIADKYLDGDTSRICPLMGVSYIQGAYPSYPLADAVIGRHLWAARQQGMTMAGYFPFHSIRTHLQTSRRNAAAVP